MVAIGMLILWELVCRLFHIREFILPAPSIIAKALAEYRIPILEHSWWTLITTLLALPLGLLVAWCLIAVVNVKAFGWRLPFHVFPLQLLQLLGVAMLASLLAALIPVLKLARMQPARLIKIFADER